MFAAIHPGKVEKLVIVDIGPDIDRRGAERVRRMAAETLCGLKLSLVKGSF